jgi:hypothetical protein
MLNKLIEKLLPLALERGMTIELGKITVPYVTEAGKELTIIIESAKVRVEG